MFLTYCHIDTQFEKMFKIDFLVLILINDKMYDHLIFFLINSYETVLKK